METDHSGAVVGNFGGGGDQRTPPWLTLFSGKRQTASRSIPQPV